MKKNRCPYCNSKKINDYSDPEFLECQNCHKNWRKESEWLHKGMKVWLNNLNGCFSKLDLKKKEKFQQHIKSFGDKWKSSDKIFKEDPRTSINILLNGMEELIEALPYFDKLPEVFLKENDDKDEIYLFVDISGEIERIPKLTEIDFWNREEKHQWKSSSERFGVIFRDGRYYRSEKWANFCRDEVDTIVANLRYTGYLMSYIEEKDKIPGMLSITEGHIFIICSTKFLENYWKTRKS